VNAVGCLAVSEVSTWTVWPWRWR